MSNPNANVRMFMGPINAAAYWIGDHLLRGADIVNDSTVTGSTVKAALNTLSDASTAVFPFTASGLAEQDLVSYDAGAATWRNRTIANALKGTGTTSLAIGASAVAAGTSDIVIGNSAGNSANTGSNNIAIGTDALDSATVALSSMIGIGNLALSGALTAAANGGVALGASALVALTSGANATAVGFTAGQSVTTGARNTLIGYATNSSATANDNSFIGDEVGNSEVGSRNTAVGSQAFNSASAAVTDCVALGYNALTGAMSSTAPSGSIAIGSTALQAVTTGLNTAVGFANQLAITTGTGNTTLGYNVMANATSGTSGIVGIGHGALGGALTNAAVYTVAVGYEALAALTTGGTNVAIGYRSMYTLTTGTSNTAIGNGALSSPGINVSHCTAIGRVAMPVCTADGTTAVGSTALNSVTSGTANCALGYAAGQSVNTGSRNTIVGYFSNSGAATDDNTYIGNAVGISTAGSRNTAVGSQAFNSASAAVTDCVALGYNALTGAMLWSTAPSGSIAIGSTALQAVTTGLNTAVGFANQLAITTGTRNTTLGYNVMSNASTAGATTDCVGIGNGALAAALTVGANGSVAVGSGALSAQTSGVNIAIGLDAGNTLTTGSSNTIIGYDADVTANSRAGCVILGRGASGAADDTLVIRMGNTSTKELTITPVTDATVRVANTYLPIKVGATQYYMPLYV